MRHVSFWAAKLRAGLLGLWGTLCAAIVLWHLLKPRFVPSDTWVQEAALTATIMGILFGVVSCVIVDRLAVASDPGDGRHRRSGADIVILLILFFGSIFGVRGAVLETAPYFASLRGDAPQSVTMRLTDRRAGTWGLPESWKLDETAWYRFSIRAPRYQPEGQAAAQSLLACPAAGSQIRLIGTGNGFGVRYSRLALVDAQTQETILIDFDEGAFQVPARCTEATG